MKKVEDGMFVSVEYTGTLENGEVFDSSEGKQPLEVEMGAGRLIKGFEDALQDMSLNEKKTFTLTPEQAYGERNPKATHSFSRSEVPAHINVQPGLTLALTSPEGEQVPAKVIHVDDEKIIVDLNHPLAGQALTFSVEIVGISATATQAGGCSCGSNGCDTNPQGGCDSGGCSGCC